MTDEPSSAYFEALEHSKAHQLKSKTFGGGLMGKHVRRIKRIIDRFEVKTMLDYGCGKGRQYERPMEEGGKMVADFWGIMPTLYDPAWEPYSKEPEGKFDMVICTHALGCIPRQDLPWAIRRLFVLASKVVYVGEQIGPIKKRVFPDPSIMPHGFAIEDWLQVLRPPFDLDPCPILVAAFKTKGDGGDTVVESEETDCWSVHEVPPHA